jgi:DNA repair photolyase
MPPVREFDLTCRSLLTKSKISSLDYAVNPYLGCEHGCAYCYATFMAKFKHIPDEWGSFVGVKRNAPQILRAEVTRGRPGVVCLGTVCDAYQPAEARHGITRACLEAFVGASGFEVGVLTKSDLVVRDIDVLARLDAPDVGFTLTCLDGDLAAGLEPGAPSPRRRLDAMARLRDRGIPVWGFFGPVLPTFSDSEETIGEMLRAMERAGASHVLVDRLNLYPRVWSRLRRFLSRAFPDRVDAIAAIKAAPGPYESELAACVEDVARSLDVQVELCF